MHIRVPVRGNRKLRQLLEKVEADKQLKAWWHVANVNAVVRLEINDHSWVHVQIVTNIARQAPPPAREARRHALARQRLPDDDRRLRGRGRPRGAACTTSACRCTGATTRTSASSSRSRRPASSSQDIYDEPERTVMVSEALQAIISHRADGEPLALEAGVLRVADALDVAKGRSRIPFERGSVSIHSLSAAAIDEVRIADGQARPVMVEILMNNSSGIYQVDGLLKAKLRGSGLEPYIEVVARIDTDAEKRLVPVYRLEIGGDGGAARRIAERLDSPSLVAGSSNGRTPGSGPGSWGSNPCPAASRLLSSPFTLVTAFLSIL